jgi:hypothetical protein
MWSKSCYVVMDKTFHSLFESSMNLLSAAFSEKYGRPSDHDKKEREALTKKFEKMQCYVAYTACCAAVARNRSWRELVKIGGVTGQIGKMFRRYFGINLEEGRQLLFDDLPDRQLAMASLYHACKGVYAFKDEAQRIFDKLVEAGEIPSEDRFEVAEFIEKDCPWLGYGFPVTMLGFILDDKRYLERLELFAKHIYEMAGLDARGSLVTIRKRNGNWNMVVYPLKDATEGESSFGEPTE